MKTIFKCAETKEKLKLLYNPLTKILSLVTFIPKPRRRTGNIELTRKEARLLAKEILKITYEKDPTLIFGKDNE